MLLGSTILSHLFLFPGQRQNIKEDDCGLLSSTFHRPDIVMKNVNQIHLQQNVITVKIIL